MASATSAPRARRLQFCIRWTKNSRSPDSRWYAKAQDDQVTVIGAGITVHEALKAADELKGQGIAIRVIDLYCVKPLDGAAIAAQLKATGGRLVTVEDHFEEGGIGEAVLSALAGCRRSPNKIAPAGRPRHAPFRQARRASRKVRNFGQAHCGSSARNHSKLAPESSTQKNPKWPKN